MVKEEKKLYGNIYKVTNLIDGKNYIGKTEKTLEERWAKHLEKAHALERAREANPHKKISGTHINNAINKYGPDTFSINQEDVAYSKAELNEKERYWVKEYDSMNPDKGYNMTEGGEGGRPSPEVIEKLRKIGQEKAKDPEWRQKVSNGVSEKYQKDPAYYDKQVNERRERAKNPIWLDKMASVNQEIARNPKYQEKMSESISNKWQEQQYQDNVSKGATNKWQEAKHRGRQFTAKREGKREIPDKQEFLKDIQDMKKKEINIKYDMDGKSINVRIKEMLGHHGVKNYSEAKKYLENKNLDAVLKDINDKLNEKPSEFKGKKEISNTREFLEDIPSMQAKEIAQKYDMNRSTVNKRIREMLGDKGVKNYTEAKNYLQDKNLDDVVKGINEKLKDQSHITEGKTIISNKKEFLKDIQELQKNEIDQKYGMDAKTVNNKIKELLGEHGVKNYTGAKEYLKDKNLDEVLKDINNKSGEKQDNPSEGTNKESKEETHEDSKQEEAKDEKQSEERDEGLNDKKGEETTEQIPEREDSKENTTGNESGESGDNKGKMETKESTGGSGLREGDLISIENIDGNNYVVVHDSINSDQQTLDGDKNSKDIDRDSIDGSVNDNGIDDISDEKIEESIEEKTEESQGQVSEESTNISDSKEEQLRTSDRKMETKYLPGQGPKEKRDNKDKVHPYIFTSGKEQRQPVQRSSKDYDGIDENPGDKKFDYDGIDTPSEDGKSDIKSLGGGVDEKGNDYDGIDNPQEVVDKDYDKLDESYGEGGYEG